MKSGREIYSEMDSENRVLTKITQSIIANEIAVNYNHEIKFTPYYKHDLKKYFNLLQKHLYNAQEKEFEMILNADEKNSIKIQDAMTDMVNELSSFKLFDLPFITEILRAYKKDPQRLDGIVQKINNQ